MYKKRFIIPLLSMLIIIFALPLWAQYDDRSMAGTSQTPALKEENYFTKPLQLIDLPTASILRGSDMDLSLRLYEEGGTLGRISVGLSRHVMLSVSYGGTNIIGDQEVDWNPMPGIRLAYRMVEESIVLPAIVLGFDSQGYGKYWPKQEGPVDTSLADYTQLHERYSVKSRGFYLVTSKGYESLVKIGLHAGINYSLERSDGDKDPTIFMGMDVLISRDMSALFEYDFATNDDKLKETNNGRGYLNIGFRWAFATNMFLEFDLKNILADHPNKSDFLRILKFSYCTSIQ